MFWATTWPWLLTFWSLQCFIDSASHARPIYQFWLSYSYRLLSYELLKLITFPLPGTVPAHAPCDTFSHIFEIHEPNLPIRRQRLTTNGIKLWRLSHCEGYRVHCSRVVSRDLCIGGLPKLHVTIFYPKMSIHYTTFMGLRRRWRTLYTWAAPMLKWFSVQKKLCPVEIRHQNGGFSEIVGSKY